MSEIEHNLAAEPWIPSGGTLKKTVVMVGMMGAGKTAVGRALAVRLGAKFLDSDAEIETAANMTVPEIFTRDGERFFRRKEPQRLRRRLRDESCLLATGGGAFMSAQNRSMISKNGVSVWLNADLDVLWNRVRHKTTRPLLRTDNPKVTLGEIYNERVPIYDLADVSVVSNGNASIEEMVDRVLVALANRPDVLEQD